MFLEISGDGEFTPIERGVAQATERFVGQDEELGPDLAAADDGGDGDRDAGSEGVFEAGLDFDAGWREAGPYWAFRNR